MKMKILIVKELPVQKNLCDSCMFVEVSALNTSVTPVYAELPVQINPCDNCMFVEVSAREV